MPRVFGAMGKEGLRKGTRFYKSIVSGGVVGLSSVEAAEAVKVFENSFRDINIAFVNEVARCFDRLGIDTREVIKGASTKPFGFMPFYPGPGVGGHCIAEDPYYLIAKASSAGVNMRFMKLAREINNGMPNFVVGIVARELGKKGVKLDGAKIAVLGVAYKANVDDVRNSPALKIIELLKKRKAVVRVFDPFLPKYSNVGSLETAVKGCDCILLATHHARFLKKLSSAFIKRSGAKVVVDARNALDKNRIKKKGVAYKGIGR
ncbi:MAG: nucleotide sugar dehydrogenase [Candidatus Diapherotrites archaeon]|nr:nucleotide sugar dehydrogenase [Candidatus Diapherotrites archaeon]